MALDGGEAAEALRRAGIASFKTCGCGDERLTRFVLPVCSPTSEIGDPKNGETRGTVPDDAARNVPTGVGGLETVHQEARQQPAGGARIIHTRTELRCLLENIALGFDNPIGQGDLIDELAKADYSRLKRGED